ncbi:hypothetical protein [Pseudoglutamicibacter cumminsii]|uniref:hypothetical protein n=1 Tax=Pseudoglutamicibacter cumminsii TaxID=156979 RepID=UPI00195D8059|nr:hypothetical protein [Pseudoglutamicibacter cumminsii]MBM7796013.1 hypothetical protein [Pseudoglutamicibacter cumminsii]
MATENQKPTAATYRRRRIVALIVLLLLLTLITLGIVSVVKWVSGVFGGNKADEKQTAQTSTQPGGENSSTGDAKGKNKSTGDAEGEKEGERPSPKPDGSQDCVAGDITVSAATDKQSYGAGEDPVLILKLKNTGDVPCTMNVGTTQQEFVVTSGNDRIFSTRDCQQDPEDVKIKLEKGQEENARFTWNRVRSVPECQPISSKPRPGTYKLKVSLGDNESKPATFVLQ